MYHSRKDGLQSHTCDRKHNDVWPVTWVYGYVNPGLNQPLFSLYKLLISTLKDILVTSRIVSLTALLLVRTLSCDVGHCGLNRFKQSWYLS